MTTREVGGSGPIASIIDSTQQQLRNDAASASQLERTSGILRRFGSFADRRGAEQLDDIGPELASEFVHSTLNTGMPPSISTMHWRRVAVRLLYRAARRDGMAASDPTLDLILPPRSSLAVRPLEDDEIALCRGCAMWTLQDSRRACAWALAEATCRSSELACVTVGDLDLNAGRVRIHGGKTTAQRWGQLTPWGERQVRRRAAQLGDPSSRLVYAGGQPAEGGQASSCAAVSDVLGRAGLLAEKDVRPTSVVAWAGREILAETGRIEVVAQRLGMSSLDRVARLIAWDWRAEG